MTGPLIRTAKEEDLKELQELASEDDHSVILPSHIIQRGNQIIGSLSLATVPMFLVYMSLKRASVVDSFCTNIFMQKAAKEHGDKVICVPCHVKSPLRPYMEKVGYSSFGTHDLMFKLP